MTGLKLDSISAASATLCKASRVGMVPAVKGALGGSKDSFASPV